MKTIIGFFRKNALYLVFLVSLMGMLGSLFFSLVWKLPPCEFCWYQRICLYPLVAISAVGIYKQDKNVFWYSIPLVIAGWLLAIYHNLLYWNIIPEAYAPCVAGVSCTTKFFEWFGFITIPFLSFSAFTFILILLILAYPKQWHKVEDAIDSPLIKNNQ